MKIENQVCTYKQAVELSSFGLSAKYSFFRWGDISSANSVKFPIIFNEDGSPKHWHPMLFSGSLKNKSLCAVGEYPLGLTVHDFVQGENSDFMISNFYPAFTISEMQVMCASMGNIDIKHYLSEGESLPESQYFSQIQFTDEIPYEIKFTYFDVLAHAWGAKLLRELKAEFFTKEQCIYRLLKQ